MSNIEDLTFEEWLNNPSNEVILHFEDDLFAQADELSEIAYGAVLDQYQICSHGSKAWKAYWHLYNEWTENWITEDTRKILEGLYEDRGNAE